MADRPPLALLGGLVHVAGAGIDTLDFGLLRQDARSSALTGLVDYDGFSAPTPGRGGARLDGVAQSLRECGAAALHCITRITTLLQLCLSLSLLQSIRKTLVDFTTPAGDALHNFQVYKILIPKKNYPWLTRRSQGGSK